MVTTWKERIEQAEKRGRFTDVDKRLVMSFDTCAVHEKINGTPEIGTRLESLGMDFAWRVDNDEVKGAKDIYKEIQKTK